MKANVKSHLLIIVFFTYLPFSFCSSKNYKTEDKKGIKGRFVNNTVLNKIADTIPGGVPAYCFEMNFVSDDSVEMTNGFEDYKIAYTKEGNNYLFLEASWKGNMPFTLINDSTIILIDTAWTGITTFSEFKKVPDSKENKWVFSYYLNKQMVAGEYILYKSNKPTTQKVVFDADGHVMGLKDYFTYEICFSGDCIGETNPPANTISFISKNNEPIDYAFKIDKKNKKLSIYEIANPDIDIIGDRAIKNMIFDLRK